MSEKKSWEINTEAASNIDLAPPPPYAQSSSGNVSKAKDIRKPFLNAMIRVASAKDADKISQIHCFWSTQTSIHRFTIPGLTAKLVKAQIAGSAALKCPFFVAEHPDSKQVVGYVFAGPRYEAEILFEKDLMPSKRKDHVHLSTAELQVYVAPEFLGQGLGKALVARAVRDLSEGRWIPEEFRGKGSVEEQKSHGFPCWKTLIVRLPIRGSRRNLKGESLAETGLAIGPMTEDEQRHVWQSLGFEEAGRLSCGITEDNVLRDEWIWQKKL